MSLISERDKKYLPSLAVLLIAAVAMGIIISFVPEPYNVVVTIASIIVGSFGAVYLEITLPDDPKNRLCFRYRKNSKNSEDPNVVVTMKFNYALPNTPSKEEAAERISDSLGVTSQNNERLVKNVDSDLGNIRKTINLDSGRMLAGEGGSTAVTNIRGELRVETTYTSLDDAIVLLFNEERDLQQSFPYQSENENEYTIICEMEDEIDIEELMFLVDPQDVKATTDDNYEFEIGGDTIYVRNLGREKLHKVKNLVIDAVTYYG